MSARPACHGEVSEGGHRGGQIVAEGTPEAIAEHSKSFTGEFLRPVLQTREALAADEDNTQPEGAAQLRRPFARSRVFIGHPTASTFCRRQRLSP